MAGASLTFDVSARSHRLSDPKLAENLFNISRAAPVEPN
jgi:hypothetical protein